MDYTEIHENYMKLQSKPLTKMTIKERNEFQVILKILINNPKTLAYDLIQYYTPRYNAYINEMQQIKQYIGEQIAFQEAIIFLAQEKINKYKNKLEE